MAPSCRTCRSPGKSCTGIPSCRLSHRIVGVGRPSAVQGIVMPVELENTEGLGGSIVKDGGRWCGRSHSTEKQMRRYLNNLREGAENNFLQFKILLN